eukprot:2977727-Rhodomonas_salina.1
MVSSATSRAPSPSTSRYLHTRLHLQKVVLLACGNSSRRLWLVLFALVPKKTTGRCEHGRPLTLCSPRLQFEKERKEEAAAAQRAVNAQAKGSGAKQEEAKAPVLAKKPEGGGGAEKKKMSYKEKR